MTIVLCVSNEHIQFKHFLIKTSTMQFYFIPAGHIPDNSFRNIEHRFYGIDNWVFRKLMKIVSTRIAFRKSWNKWECLKLSYWIDQVQVDLTLVTEQNCEEKSTKLFFYLPLHEPVFGILHSCLLYAQRKITYFLRETKCLRETRERAKWKIRYWEFV